MQIEQLQMTPVHMSATSHLGETQQAKEPDEVKTFSECLVDALKETNELQHKSDALNAALAAGQVDDISQVVIAGQKAELALQLTLQVRNKAISAYQELMRMQI